MPYYADPEDSRRYERLTEPRNAGHRACAPSAMILSNPALAAAPSTCRPTPRCAWLNGGNSELSEVAMHDPVSFGGGLVSQDLDHTTIQPVCAVSGPNCQHCAVAVLLGVPSAAAKHCFNCGNPLRMAKRRELG